MDSKLSPAQADPPHDGDVVLSEPKDWTDAKEVLSKLAHVAPARPTARSNFSADPRVTEPSLDATLRSAGRNKVPTREPSLGRRISRSAAGFLVAACGGAAATLAWESYGGPTEQMIASSVPQLRWLSLPSPTLNPPATSEIAVEHPSPLAAPASAPQAVSAQAGGAASTASETAASTAPTVAPSPELQQLEAIARDLAAVRESVEQLAAGQEQMARDIAKLQMAGQDIRRRVSALPPAAATTARKPVPPLQPTPPHQ